MKTFFLPKNVYMVHIRKKYAVITANLDVLRKPL